MLKEYDLEGRVAIVTGAGRGIGKGIALTLAEAGADVVVAARTREQLEVTAAEIRKLGRRSLAVPTDVTKQSDVEGLVKHTIKEFGKIDTLVNNAGIVILKPIAYIPGMQLEGWQVADSWDTPLSVEEWHRVLDTDLTSAFLFAKAVGPHMLGRRSGKIINISSNSAELSPPYFSSYCVSKAALSMFTRCLASEWGPYNINVNAIGPGSVLTELSAPVLADPERNEAILKAVPMGRTANPREIGLLAVYLASDASSYVTGQTFYIDGGQVTRGNGY
ncbi:MAG: SDR family oxidoreductase [Syntrophorhabdales bacterium]|jgi:NAD(P)-dependent dehydrogenase (short-subunit alcohol dehydrogenase family)